MGAVSFDDAWGVEAAAPPPPPPSLEAPLTNTRKRPKPRKDPGDRMQEMVLHELRRMRIESAQRSSQITLIACGLVVTMVLFLALSWNSNQKMIQHMSYMMWCLERDGSTGRPRLTEHR